jgi:hypothetical protein
VPQICDALEKAALDPRIVGVVVEINPLAVSGGGGKGEGMMDLEHVVTCIPGLV